jgi:RNA polymerase sigma-70 factor (ECF subfamily)
MDKPSSESLVVRILEGDKRAFEEIVDEHEKTIFNLVYRMVHNHEDAKDLTQTVFIKAYENLHSYNPAYRFFSWLYRIAINECLNHNTKRKKVDQLKWDPPDRRHNPEDHIVTNELSDQISGALMMLKIPYRTVLVLKHFNDFSYREISEILGIPEKTVKSRLFTGRQLLRDYLIQQGISL